MAVGLAALAATPARVDPGLVVAGGAHLVDGDRLVQRPHSLGGGLQAADLGQQGRNVSTGGGDELSIGRDGRPVIRGLEDVELVEGVVMGVVLSLGGVEVGQERGQALSDSGDGLL